MSESGANLQSDAPDAMRLLLVDDDEIDRKAILRALRQWSCPHVVTEAATADEALQTFAHGSFDAVLLDYRLPDMDGLEVLRRMNSRRLGSTAILMLTGMDNDDLATQCIEAGAQDFLLKQEVSPRHLQRAVTHARMRHRIELALVESHERLRELAEQDPLTGLANRYFFDQSLRAAIPRTRRYGLNLALLLLDIDNFKLINDSHGHDVGDQLLRAVAQRLAEVTREGDILCRLGGDEFAILAFQVGHDDSIHLLSQRLLAAMSAPVEINGAALPATVSIGIAISPDNTSDADELFKCADLAMYRAKRDGRNQAHYFSEDLHRQVMRRVQTERDLRSALARSEFEVFYQPQIDVLDGSICGAEALVRWRHPERGLLCPGEFLDVAEDTGLIEQLGLWVLEAACADAAGGGLDCGTPLFRVAVNLSARQLRASGLVDAVRGALDRSGLPPERLELEITESTLIADIDSSMQTLEEIAALGVDIVLDDFGTGYSSLSYLKRLPISTLKVDKSFLSQVPEGEKDKRLLEALIHMARAMGFRVIVEGVERPEQAGICRTYGADAMQGFLFARPMPRQELAARLRG
ncbi:putative bifunctional diguanylate cyclase/phosphodiesterase [Oleispirillum naphthae]|uniref:putative bifunctional diguanylate cyclase/phosphodiesterase n=1 Tax=Oleispirillum naphthae TaxID=2838853 RepID=UPI00308252EC